MEDNKIFTNRELNLLSRGYSKEDILKVKNYSNDDILKIFNLIIERITKNCKKDNNPKCVIIGGQPGSGKTTYSMLYNTRNENKFVEIGIDNYRMYHPYYLEIEEIIKKHWKNRKETENDTPGNDIADFTHSFAGMMTDLIIDRLTRIENGVGYNVLLEWGMRTPEGPLKSIKNFKEKGYDVDVIFLGVNKDVSLSACKLRADLMKDGKHIIRKVPNAFHELCIKSLPDSCNSIYINGHVINNYIHDMKIINRKENVLWSFKDNCLPGIVLSECINNNQYKDINQENIAYDIYENEATGLVR